MKKIDFEYKVSTSHRPAWLLRFLADIGATYYYPTELDTQQCLKNISSILDNHNHVQRTLKRSCSGIKREIDGETLKIYSSTGRRVLVVIKFKNL